MSTAPVNTMRQINRKRWKTSKKMTYRPLKIFLTYLHHLHPMLSRKRKPLSIKAANPISFIGPHRKQPWLLVAKTTSLSLPSDVGMKRARAELFRSGRGRLSYLALIDALHECQHAGGIQKEIPELYRTEALNMSMVDRGRFASIASIVAVPGFLVAQMLFKKLGHVVAMPIGVISELLEQVSLQLGWIVPRV